MTYRRNDQLESMPVIPSGPRPPSASNRERSSNRQRAIAFMTNDTGHGQDYQGLMRHGIEQACVEAGVALWVYAGKASWITSRAQRRIYGLVHPSRIDGVLVASGCIAAHACVDEVLGAIRRRCKRPMCALGQACDGVPSIVVDNHGGAMRMVEHLVRVHGRRRFVYVAGPPNHAEADERFAGTRDALTSLGLELRPECLLRGEFSTASGREAVRQLLAAGIPFDAVVTANDDMASGALEMLREAGVECPAKVSVAGFDDSASAAVTEPGLTTTRQPICRIGAAGVAHILAAWEGREVPSRVVFGTELVVRGSCGCQDTTAWTVRDEQERIVQESAAVEELLAGLFHDEYRRRHWARELLAAVEAERKQEAGALPGAIVRLVRQLHGSHLPLQVLQRLVTGLRLESSGTGDPTSRELEEAFHASRALIGEHAYKRVADHLIREEVAFAQLRASWEHLATALTWPDLERALTTDLSSLGIRDAVISMYMDDDVDHLVPLMRLENGHPVAPPGDPHPAELLVPEGAFQGTEGGAVTVLSLTFENQELGVAVLRLPMKLEIYEILREQIGSAIKVVRLHEEIIRNERLHALAQEEKRAAAEHLKSLSLIAGGVAHDLNNVLGPLLALPEAIDSDLRSTSIGEIPERVYDDLETIRQAAQRAANTIGDLVALGRSTETEKKPLDLTRLLQGEHRTFAAICGRESSIRLRVETDPKPLIVRASRPHLIRAISNLVINAVDAVGSEGSIAIRAKEREVLEPLVGVNVVEPGRYAVIEVEDSGSGIAAEHLPHVLEPFYSVKQRSGRVGSGLGLTIVRRIVQDSAGSLHVSSRVGQGTTFSIYLPVLAECVMRSTVPPARIAGEGEHILVVDDEIVQLKTARRILQHLGYAVVTASSPDEALVLHAEAPFDLVIADMVMPGGMSGIALIERMRTAQPSQRALIASGYSPETGDEQAESRGLVWLQKPYSVAALASAVRRALGE